MTSILDLRHASAQTMRPLLEDEAALWERLLRWDYRTSVNLLLEYLDNRVLPGFLAQENGAVVGYAFGVQEAQKAVLGDCYAPSAFQRPPGTEGNDATLRSLMGSLLSLLKATPGVGRIESQLLLYPAGSLAGLLGEEGFKSFPRFFMECELSRESVAAMPAPRSALLGERLVLRRWLQEDYQAAAELIQVAYEGHIDAEINDQYRSLHGSLRFLHNIVRFPGCGVFQPSHSWLLTDRTTGQHAGMLLCSRIADDVAHVTQLCVAPQFRHQQLGYALLSHGMRVMAHAGYRALSLTVTAANTQALRLYEQTGFAVRRDFDAAVWEPGVTDTGGLPVPLPGLV